MKTKQLKIQVSEGMKSVLVEGLLAQRGELETKLAEVHGYLKQLGVNSITLVSDGIADRISKAIEVGYRGATSGGKKPGNRAIGKYNQRPDVRKKTSLRMKKYWADRKKAEAKAGKKVGKAAPAPQMKVGKAKAAKKLGVAAQMKKKPTPINSKSKKAA
jgi:hypothetical protein